MMSSLTCPTAPHPDHDRGRGGVEYRGRPHKTGKGAPSKRASIRVIGPWCQHLKVLLLKPGQKPLEAKSLFCPDLPSLTLGLKNGGMRRGCWAELVWLPTIWPLTPRCSPPSEHRPHRSLWINFYHFSHENPMFPIFGAFLSVKMELWHFCPLSHKAK